MVKYFLPDQFFNFIIRKQVNNALAVLFQIFIPNMMNSFHSEEAIVGWSADKYVLPARNVSGIYMKPDFFLHRLPDR